MQVDSDHSRVPFMRDSLPRALASAKWGMRHEDVQWPVVGVSS
jgi:hypothetical protein